MIPLLFHTHAKHTRKTPFEKDICYKTFYLKTAPPDNGLFFFFERQSKTGAAIYAPETLKTKKQGGFMSEASSKNPHLDRVTEKFVKNLAARDAKPLYELPPQEARQFLVDLQRATRADINAEISDVNIFTETAGSVDVRLVRPENSNEIMPVILYIHGGGWILGDKETHDMLIRKLATHTNSVVAFVNYSRSPEAQYPVAINQIYGVLKYLYENPQDFNIDPNRIALAGDSAGGNMAAVTAIRAKAEGGPKIIFQALLYPVTDAGMDTESYKKFKDGPWLSKKAMEWFWDAYMPDKKSRKNSYVSPLQAELSELEGLPPVLVITAENDVLRDEGEAYARKLDKAGVNVLSIRINNTHHDFLMLNALAGSEAVKGAFSILCSEIIRHFNL